MRRISLLTTLFMLAASALPAAAADITVDQTARLIRLAERNVTESRGWAADMLDVLRDHDLDRNRENVCAAIAVIDQESGFHADPAVPGLGRISEAALREKMGRVPIAGSIVLRMLETSPTPDDSYLLRIRNARTERDLDLVFRSFISDASRRTSMDMIVNSGLLNKMIESRNDIDTAGSMQVAVKFSVDVANRSRWLPMQLTDIYAVRDELYTRRGGMYYGILQLLGYDSGYDRKVYRFADYNAGRYASRNAAFQLALAKLSDTQLALDGDLLLYDAGEARAKASASEQALRQVAKDLKLDLDDKRIRKDLLQEKSENFVSTRTFMRIRDAYRLKTGKDAPFAIIPDIRLNSPKISRQMTTRTFAESVNKRYQSCIAAKI